MLRHLILLHCSLGNGPGDIGSGRIHLTRVDGSKLEVNGTTAAVVMAAGVIDLIKNNQVTHLE